MITQVGSFKLPESINKFKDEKTRLPRVLGVLSLRHFLEGFRKGGFTDDKFVRWQKRFKRLPRGRFSRTLKEPANLIKTGALRRSIRIKNATFSQIKIFTSIKYASKHNIGIPPIPQRKFVGDSKVLVKDLKKRIFKETDKVFKV